MEAEKLKYIEETGLYFEQLGLTRMAGRVFGYLLVCDRDAVSFDEIRKVLQASKGSISATLRQLLQVKFVEALSLPGDRKTYYRVSKMPIGHLLRARLKAMEEFSNMLGKANRLKHREDEVSKWIAETALFYRWAEARIEEMIDRWDREKETIAREEKHHEYEN